MGAPPKNHRPAPRARSAEGQEHGDGDGDGPGGAALGEGLQHVCDRGRDGRRRHLTGRWDRRHLGWRDRGRDVGDGGRVDRRRQRSRQGEGIGVRQLRWRLGQLLASGDVEARLVGRRALRGWASPGVPVGSNRPVPVATVWSGIVDGATATMSSWIATIAASGRQRAPTVRFMDTDPPVCGCRPASCRPVDRRPRGHLGHSSARCADGVAGRVIRHGTAGALARV